MKISYCTFLLNNFIDVEKNFIFNLNCIKYFNGNVEWILLNINDGSEDFIKTDNFIKKYYSYFIKKNLLYYYVLNTKNINISAFKNATHFLANNDFLINLNINTQISILDTEILITSENKDIIFQRKETDAEFFCNEIIGINKETFIQLKGYNENFTGYGFIVQDFINRLKNSNVNIINFTYPDVYSLKYLKTSSQTKDYLISFQNNKLISELPFDNSISNNFIKEIKSNFSENCK